MLLQKKALIFLLLLIFIIIGSLSIYFYFQKENQKQQQQTIQELLKEFNQAINLMDSVKDEMPKELLEVHRFLIDKGQKNEIKFTQIPPELKDFILFHGAKHQILYVDPAARLSPQIWIPLLYHEAGHLYWHSKYPVETLEEFQGQLYASEEHSYTVDAQAWDLVMKYYPIKKDELKTELEQRLFKLYSNETEIYNEMMKGNLEAKGLWVKIIEEDIRVKKEQQEFLK